MRTADSVNSGAHSLSSDWAESDGEGVLFLVPVLAVGCTGNARPLVLSVWGVRN